jgi:hypothetical protein
LTWIKANLTFIYVNDRSFTRSIHADMLQSEYLAATQQERTRWLRPSPLIAPTQKARDSQRVALALHLDCSRTHIGKLETEGVIPRQGDGFLLNQNRVAYLRCLRRAQRYRGARQRHLDRFCVSAA